MAVPAHLVELFDPANPTSPRLELAANFDPRRHVRWEHRPSVAPLDLASIPGREEGKPLLTGEEVTALQGAGITSLKSVLAAGPDGLANVQGVSKRSARDLATWAQGRHASAYAQAEVDAETAQAQAQAQQTQQETVQPTVTPTEGEAG